MDNITFLKDQLRQKDKAIDSSINQFSQKKKNKNRNIDDQLARNLESVKYRESVKSKETEKAKTTQTTAKRKTLEKGRVKKLRKTNSHNKNSEQDISHETEPTNTSNRQ